MELSKVITELIDDGLKESRKLEPVREYLGASRLGVGCNRALQFEYYDTPKNEGRDFSGRILRIFEAGHIFESLMIKWLRNAGFELITEKESGKQFGFSVLDGKIKGHIDAVITKAPVFLGLKFPMLWECKSLKKSSWNETVNKGVSVSNPIYAGQMASYQAYMENEFPGISKQPALFTAINKDTAEIHFELVPFDGELAQRCSDKGLRIIEACEAGEILPRISRDPSHFECKMCEWSERCWQEPTSNAGWL